MPHPGRDPPTRRWMWLASKKTVLGTGGPVSGAVDLLFGEMGGTPKVGGKPPKWMVYKENPIKMDGLGGKPTIFGNPQMTFCSSFVKMMDF